MLTSALTKVVILTNKAILNCVDILHMTVLQHYTID